ncbi:polysaccharide biosynthesis protein [Methanosarcina mazei]|uniref:Polysaccharide biosynthesis protein n=1 Tax=Methanosarcina mazei TaxID=2209 RepID=A0A0F8C6V1_METMZ|nr:flippase [Methanosarcina mazei]KKG00519.1 polysaccharide biosynthesis protein [Methanosarcina mazei]
MFNFKLSKTMWDVQWSFISLVTASLSHFLLRIVLGRELGSSGLGVYTLVFTIYLFGMQFAAFGIGAALTKYVAEFSDDLAKTKEYISSGLIGSVVTGSAMGLILYLLSGTISINVFKIPEMEGLLKITSLCFPFIALQKVALGTLNGFREMKTYALLDITLNGLVLLISVFFVIILEMGAEGAVYGFVLPTILIGIVSLTFIRSYFVKYTGLLNNITKDITLFGFYVVLSSSVGMLYHNVDSLMLGYFMDETNVGYYSIAVIFIQGLTLVPNSIQKITTPTIASYYGKKEYNKIVELMKNILLKAYILTFLFSICLALAGKQLIIFLFTAEFLPAYIPLLILLIGYSINAPIGSIGGVLGGIGKVNISFRIALVSSLINIVANFLLIPKYGLIGASAATSFSFIISTLVYYIVLKKIFQNLVSSSNSSENFSTRKR